eukprot:COSAG06_NODE_16376_length_1004_cov_1.583425_2_plen_100_part_01
MVAAAAVGQAGIPLEQREQQQVEGRVPIEAAPERRVTGGGPGAGARLLGLITGRMGVICASATVKTVAIAVGVFVRLRGGGYTGWASIGGCCCWASWKAL